MKRIWHNYKKWEDYDHKFYCTKKIDNEDIAKSLIFRLFTNQALFYKFGKEFLKEWPYCRDYNLSNTASNRKSYLGQVVACFAYNIPSRYTAKFFTQLAKKDQEESNITAIKLIKLYEEKYYNDNHAKIIRGKNEKLS